VVDPPGMQSFCDRAVDGIASVFLALKRRPIIRYQRTSDAAKRIARETAVGQLSLCNVSIKII
jgi:vacuolar protein sorting-associated protein 45